MSRIIHKKWFHQLIKVLRLQHISRRILKMVSPTFKHEGISYRLRTPESFSIASEVFKRPTYDRLLRQVDVRTVVDLGCNTGFFTCLLASRYGSDSLKGVLVDADAEVLEECRWHLRENGIDGCQSVCAIVGPADTETADFYVADFNISSSTRPFDDSYPFPLQTVRSVSCPVVSLASLFETTFGNERINLLKVDIEGSEKELLAQDLACLQQVDWIVIEWHKWVLQLDYLNRRLGTQNFQLISVLKEDTICGLALYQNEASPNRVLEAD